MVGVPVGGFWVVNVLKPKPEIRNRQEASSAEYINIRVFSDDALNVLPKITCPRSPALTICKVLGELGAEGGWRGTSLKRLHVVMILE